MTRTDQKLNNNDGPSTANVDSAMAQLELSEPEGDFAVRAAQNDGAIAFVHFDPNTTKSSVVEVLIHHDDLLKVHRGLYVRILSTKDKRQYSGRVIEGPFFAPDALKRDSTPVRFLILNQGQGKVLSVPEYHGWAKVEILGEERDATIFGAVQRPHPASPVFPYNSSMMSEMLHLDGNIKMGILDNYDDVFVQIDGNDKGVVPRNWMTVGTVGSGKSNTTQVFIEETLKAGYAQIVVDPEGEYIFMNQPSDAKNIKESLGKFDEKPSGVKNIKVYRPPLSESKCADAIEFSVPFDSLSPEIVPEITEMSPAQKLRFPSLYEQAIQLLKKQSGQGKLLESDDLDISRGYQGITLKLLLNMIDEEMQYFEWKRANKNVVKPKKSKPVAGNEENNEEIEGPEELKIYCHKHQLIPLIQDQHDLTSYGALRKKLRALDRLLIFDRTDASPLHMQHLTEPGQLSVIDMSDSREQAIVNIVIADLLARLYHYKMNLTEEENTKRKVFLTIEEAHGFVSREKQDKMEQTLDQLRRIARRGRKRWLALHFITQSPQHLPSELFELANNKIIHQITGPENLRVLKAAAGTVNEAIWNDVPSLGRGRAIIVSAQYPHPIIAQIRPAASKRNYIT